MELRNFMKKDILFYTFLVSLIIAIISYVVLLIIFMVTKSLDAATVFTSLICFIPTILIALTSFIGSKIKNKNSKIIKIFIAILNSLVIFLVQVCIGGFILLFGWSFANMANNDKLYTDINQYNTALKSVWNQNRIKHFPKEIPANAKYIALYKDSNSWFGSENIALKFKINKQYIDKTIKKYKYTKIDEPYGNKLPYPYKPGRWVIDQIENDISNYRYYIIGDNNNDKSSNFVLEYGIAVNENTNEIIFYYANPD